MKGIFLLLSIIGSVLSLQYPVEYHYQYEGRIASGIPSIRPQAVALGIKAKLVLLMKEKTQAVAQLVDVQVGEYNDDVVCLHLRGPVLFEWKPMPAPFKDHLEQPFAVYFAEESGHVMKVPRTDIEFVTNIRKSVVEMLKSEPLIGNLGGIKGDVISKFISGGRKPDAFSVQEETILGRCESQYSITKLPQHLSEMERLSIASHIKMDEQSEESPRNGGTNIPKLQEQYWHLVRSINLDNCTDRTMQEHAGGVKPHHVGRSQLRSVHSRSSISTYLLKGLPGSFRVERAVVEGDVIVNPFGFKSEKLQTVINQTLVLESAKAITTVLRLPAVRNVKSWQYEVSSPFPAPNHPKQWMNYHDKRDKYYPVSLQDSVGLPSTKEEIEEHKKSFMAMMDKVIENLYTDTPVPSPSSPPSKVSTKSSIASSFLHRMTKIMKVLPLDAVREIFNEIFRQHDVQAERKQTIVIDVAAASGASAPIKVLLEKITKNEISKTRAASIFWTLPNNIISPAVIQDLMNYVKSMDIEKEPMLTSSATINFAIVAKRVCLENRTSNLAIPNEMFGKEECERSLIERDFLRFLSDKAVRSSKPFDRAVYLQAISNLGSPKILPVLKPWVHAEHDNSINVRLTAIYGLSKKRLPESVREEVFDILMPIVESVEERADIRQAAVASLISWHPHASWWQRMARSTWKERNHSMAAFITFSIESLAKSTEPRLLKQARIAEFALPMLKPFSPSQKYSFNAIHSRWDHHSKIGTDFVFSLIRSAARREDSHEATEVYASLKENFGGLHWDMFEASITSVKVPSMMEEWINTYGFKSKDEILASNPKSSFSRMMLETNYHGKPDPKEDNPSLFLRIFDNMYQYVDLKKVWEELSREDLIEKVMKGHSLNITKHLNPVDIEYFLPTEMGLPLMGSVVMPTTHMVHAHVKLDREDHSVPTFRQLFMDKNSTWTLNSTTKYMSKLIVKMSTMAPWNKKMYEAGIENHHEINLPFSVKIKLNISEEIANASIHISPNDEQKVPVLHSHNIPFTQVRNVVPSSEESFASKVISVQKSEKPTNEIERHFDSKYTGMATEYDFTGDAPNPFTSANVKDYMRKPVLMGKLLTSPTAKQWQYSVVFDPKSSATKRVDIVLAYLNLKPVGRGPVIDVPDLSVKDDKSQRMEKLRRYSEGSNVHGVDAQIRFSGSEWRLYEAVWAMTRRDDSSTHRTEYKTTVAVLADKIPGQTNDPKALCSEIRFDTPTIHNLEDLKRVLTTGAVENIDSKMYWGNSCQSTQIGKMTGSLKMSSERQAGIKEELSSLMDYDRHNPTVHLPIAVVYDEIRFEMDFEMDKIPKPLINMSYSLRDNIDGYLFPRGYYDNMFVGEPNKIVFEAVRPLYTERYNFWVNMPQRHAIYTEIHVPNVVTRLVPWVGLMNHESNNSNFVLASEGPGKCTIKKGVLYSFDGLKFNFSPLHCWTKAAVDLDNPSLYEVLVSETKLQMLTSEIRINNEQASATVTCTYENATINGKLMDNSQNKHVVNDNNGQPIIEVFRRNKYFEMHLINNMTVRVYRAYIEITPEDNVRAKLRGVCGDFDGSTKYDKTGPENCLYTEESKDVLFKYSWTEKRGNLCDATEYDKMTDRVQQYQKNCTHRPDTVWSSIFETSNCYQKVYPVKKVGPGYCVSDQPVQICAKGCTSHGFKQIKVLTGCWQEDHVPSDVKAAEAVGYMTQRPAEKAPFQGATYVHWDTDCQ